MDIKSLSLDATCRLEKFCKKSGIKFSSELSDVPEIRIYDFWLDDSAFNMIVKPNEIYFYTGNHDCLINRHEFQEVKIL